MKEKNCAFVSLFLFVWWFAGMTSVSGSWKIVAILIPPYAWYVFADRLLKSLHI